MDTPVNAMDGIELVLRTGVLEQGTRVIEIFNLLNPNYVPQHDLVPMPQVKIPAQSNVVAQISNLRANLSKQHGEHFMAENSQLATQYIAAFASNENGSAVDLFIVLFTINPSTVAAVLDIYEVLAAAVANCNRSAIKMGSITRPAHAGPNITNEDLYPLLTLDAKRWISTDSQKALGIYQRKRRTATV
ncbi:unnamed protein product [Didymodactylos carnosus]|uniref:Uncharacterized protein n=1 Tax=Didymodactylos carnosus TaxID=1234261 RepID=A0A814EDZ4_9BILA|nr:unnamed protein product [Didymodactylos carnosus]CAF1175237.1 unnamed protein product [Didymodactylos carnosus]CAF3739635.1 unnamed protein product [Didymodactylos carnosus]CAF3986456.1 unnamed protein product [Didymodactylos carnosus]